MEDEQHKVNVKHSPTKLTVFMQGGKLHYKLIDGWWYETFGLFSNRILRCEAEVNDLCSRIHKDLYPDLYQ